MVDDKKSNEMKNPPGAKSEMDIMKRIANLYAELESIREERRSTETPKGEGSGPRIILVTRRLPREAREDQGLSSSGTSAALQFDLGFRRRQRLPDSMDQALANFRQIGTLGREVIWVGRPHDGQNHSINFAASNNRQDLKDNTVNNNASHEMMIPSPTTSNSVMSSPGVRGNNTSSLSSITSGTTIERNVPYTLYSGGGGHGSVSSLKNVLSATTGSATPANNNISPPCRSQFIPVYLDEIRERQFYNGFCKRVLWPLFHSSPPTTRDVVARARPPRVQGRCSAYADHEDDENQNEAEDARQLWAAYVAANRAYADAVADVAREGDLIWIQDYHFMLVPQMLRSTLGETKAAEAKLGFFLHVPFPSSELYRMLPYREEILRGILAADLVGFQTYDYARHFLSSCEIVLGIETSPDRIEHDGHQTRICVCPVGIEPDVVRQRISNPGARASVQRLENQLSGRTLVLSVDTLDPTKGLVHKFLALEELFDRHPELADQMVFVQVALGGGGTGGLSSAREGDDAMSEIDDDNDDDEYLYGHDDNQVKRSPGDASSKTDIPGMPIDDDLDENVLDTKPRGSVFERLGATARTTPAWSRGPLNVPNNKTTTTTKKWQNQIDPSPSIVSGASGRRSVDRLAKAHRRYNTRASTLRSGGIFSTLERQLHSMVTRINSKLATIDFEGPVQYLSVTQPEAEETMLAAMFALADILVCTPIRDGMNVVPFEYLVARDEVGRVASVLLSEFAGCARSLGGASLINPWDTSRFASTLHKLIKRARAKLKHKNALRKVRSLDNAANTIKKNLIAKTFPHRSNNVDKIGGISTNQDSELASNATVIGKPSTHSFKTVKGNRRGRPENRHQSLEPPVSALERPRHRSSSGTPGKRKSLLTPNLDIGLDYNDEDVDDEDFLIGADDDEEDEEDEQTAHAPAASGESQRRRNHQHMLQYVSTFTAQSWAGRFLLQLQEASETKASRTLCREIKVPQLVSPYTKTTRRLIVLQLEGVLVKPCALPELLVIPERTLEAIRSMCRDEANRMVVVMSARSARVLERVFAPILTSGPVPTNLVLAAEAGLAIKWRPEDDFFEMQVPPHDVDLSWHVDAAPLIEYYTERTPGSVVEVKESGLAWHYRDCDLNHGAWQARQLRVALGELAKHIPLSVFSGDKYIEVRPMRLSVPNVLEAALRKLNHADAGMSDDEQSNMLSQPLPAAVEMDEGLSEGDRRRSVDFVLYIASGNGLVDEEIFESMAPPPFDLDEFCYRVQKLSAGERLEDDNVSSSQNDLQCSTIMAQGEQPPMTVDTSTTMALNTGLSSSLIAMRQEHIDDRNQAPSTSSIQGAIADGNTLSEPALQGLEVATLGQFAAVMTGSEIDKRKKIPDPLREHLKRKAREPSSRMSKQSPSKSELQTPTEEHSPTRPNYQPRRDFPPSAMLFQAMRRRYGRDWSRVDLPTTASACWALVGGRAPRPGAPISERSTFLADFEDIHGGEAPDVEFSSEEKEANTSDIKDEYQDARLFPARHIPSTDKLSLAKSVLDVNTESAEAVRDSSLNESMLPAGKLPSLAPHRKLVTRAHQLKPSTHNNSMSGAGMLTRALEMNALALSRAVNRDNLHIDDSTAQGAAAVKSRVRRQPISPSSAQFRWRKNELNDKEHVTSLTRHHRSYPLMNKVDEWQGEDGVADREDSSNCSGDAYFLQTGFAASSYDDLSVTSTPPTPMRFESSNTKVQENRRKKDAQAEVATGIASVEQKGKTMREQSSGNATTNSTKFQIFQVYNAAPPLWGDVPIVDTSSKANKLVPGCSEVAQNEEYHVAKRARGNDTVTTSIAPQPSAQQWRTFSGWSKSAANDKSSETVNEALGSQLSRLRTRTMTPPPRAARGAATEQERREFDRAARVATAARLRSGPIQEKRDANKAESSYLPDGATNLSQLLSRPTSILRYASPSEKLKSEYVENKDIPHLSSMTFAPEHTENPESIVEEVISNDFVPAAASAENTTEAAYSAQSQDQDLEGTATIKRSTGSHSTPLSPTLGEAIPLPMASLAAAAAAAAANDDDDGLDLPLQTFSCIVGIKLSQATCYLKSTDMVATLLQEFAQCSSSSAAVPLPQGPS